MEIILNDIFLGFKYLFGCGIFFLIYIIIRENTDKHNFKKMIWKGLIVCLLFSGMIAFTLGNSSCEEMEYDIMGSHCLSYADDDFLPSMHQRIGKFLFTIIFIYPPVFVGAFSKRHDEKIVN